MKELRNVLPSFAAFLCIAATSTQIYGQKTENPWRVASNDQGGINTSTICLARDDGRWIEVTQPNPASCKEKVIANRDTRWVWPDDNFYSDIKSRKNSLLFDSNDGTFAAVVVLSPRKEAILEALEQSGTLARLENEIEAGVESENAKKCTDIFKSARNVEDLDAARQRCGGTISKAAAAIDTTIRKAVEEQRVAQYLKLQQDNIQGIKNSGQPFAAYTQGVRVFYLQNAKCKMQPGWKAGFAIANGTPYPSCWSFSNDNPSTIAMCFIYQGKLSNDCWFASKNLYMSLSSKSKRAF